MELPESAEQYMRAVSQQQRAAFAEMRRAQTQQEGQPVSEALRSPVHGLKLTMEMLAAADDTCPGRSDESGSTGAAKPNNTKKRPRNLLASLFSSAALPPSLSRNELPPSSFVRATLRHFEACRALAMDCRSLCSALSATQAKAYRERAPVRVPTVPNVVQWHRHLAESRVVEVSHGEMGPSLGVISCVLTACCGTLVHVTTRNLVRCYREHERRSVPASPQHKPNGSSVNAEGIDPCLFADEQLDPFAVAPSTVVSLTSPPTSARFEIKLDRLDLPEDVADLLRFVAFMRHDGGGAWVWTALATIELPLVADTERELQEVLRVLCRHIKTMVKVRPDLSPTQLTFSSSTLTSSDEMATTVDALERKDMWALQSLLVVVGRFFKQANPSLVPL